MNRQEKTEANFLCCLFISIIAIISIVAVISSNNNNGVCLAVEEIPINYVTTSSSGTQYYNIEFIAKFNKECEADLEDETDIRHYYYQFIENNLAGEQMFDNIMNAYNETIQFSCKQKTGIFSIYTEDETFKCD